VQPHVTRAEEAFTTGRGRSLMDAALTLQQDRIRNSADEAFAESLALPENLGSVEQIRRNLRKSITWQPDGTEGKAGDLKHQMVEEALSNHGMV